MDLNLAIKNIVREELTEQLAASSHGPPVLISVDDVVELCGCDKSVIQSLITNASANGFPVIRLGPKTLKVDRARLFNWLNAGGLQHGEHNKERRSQVRHPPLKAVERAA